MNTVGSKKRVLVLTSTFPRWKGDSEPPFVFELSRRLSEDFDVLVLAPHANGAKRLEHMDGIEVMRFRYFFPQWEKLAYEGGILANLKKNRWCYLLLPFFFIAQVVALLRILRKQKVDLIHAHWLIPQGLSVAIAGHLVKSLPPVICTSHGGDLMGLNGWVLRPIKRWAIRCSSLITLVSHAMVAHAHALGARPDRIHVVSMGVDTGTLFEPNPDTLRVNTELLSVGRLVEKKGTAYLIDALPEILRHQPDIHLSIVGDGPLAETLKRQVNGLDLSHAVTFYGAVNNVDLPAFYQRATIFIAPSVVTAQGDQEGLGLVLIEAMACECPVVVSDLPAIHDVVSHGRTGWFVPQKSHEEIAEAVLMLLRKPNVRNQLGKNGRNHVTRNFDWATVAERYAVLFNKVIRIRA